MTGLRYIAGCKDIRGDVFDIEVYKAGYSGSPEELKLANSPLLRMDKAKRVKGTSLEMSFVSRETGALIELYTTDPFSFKVLLKKNSTVIWSGFIQREQYAEDYTQAPYSVDVTATDGLGLLKDYSYSLAGQHSPVSFLYNVFTKINLPLDLAVFSELSLFFGGTYSRRWLDSATTDFSLIAEDYYSALENFLETINAYITQRDNRWVVERNPDIRLPGLLYSAGVYVSDIAPREVAIKPIGALTLNIEPSKRDVEITEKKTYPVSILKNHLFDSTSSWSTNTGVYGAINGERYLQVEKIVAGGQISQNINLGQGYSYSLRIDYSAIDTGAGAAPRDFTIALFRSPNYLGRNGWGAYTDRIRITAAPAPEATAERQQFEITFSSAPGHTGFLDSYKVTIEGFQQTGIILRLYEASLTILAPQDKKLLAEINPAASQDADNHELHFGDQDGIPNLINFLAVAGVPTSSWRHAFISGGGFRDMMAKDVINEHLTNRAKLSGYTEEIGDVYLDGYSGKIFFAITYDYDLISRSVSADLIEIHDYYNVTLGAFQDGSYYPSSPSGGRPAQGGGGGSGVSLGETEFTAYRGDRGKSAYEHSLASASHFDATTGAGKVTKSQAAALVANLGDGSEVNSALAGKADKNGNASENFAANNLTINKITLNGVELTIVTL